MALYKRRSYRYNIDGNEAIKIPVFWEDACTDVSEPSGTSVLHLSCCFHYLQLNTYTVLPDYTASQHKSQQSLVIAAKTSYLKWFDQCVVN